MDTMGCWALEAPLRLEAVDGGVGLSSALSCGVLSHPAVLWELFTGPTAGEKVPNLK